MERHFKWLLLVLVCLSMGWCLRPVDPDAWRSFAREPTEEVRQLYFDDDGRSYQRWHYYVEALRAGDAEAIQLAPKVCASTIADEAAHPLEDLMGALGWNLERRPEEILQLMTRCYPSHPVLVCVPFDHDTESVQLEASLNRRRAAVKGLLDGGFSELAAACLEELRE
jgi:hypothetical protein